MPWPVRVRAYKHQTTLDGTRVIYPDGAEWEAHYLFDRVGVYTKAYDQSASPLSLTSSLHAVLESVSRSCSGGSLGGLALDSISNVLAAFGMACASLRDEVFGQGRDRSDHDNAIEIVMASLREEAQSIESASSEVLISSVYFTSQMAEVFGTIVLDTLRKNDAFWNSEVVLPKFLDQVANKIQSMELMEKAVRAAVLGHERCLQVCLAVIPTSLSLLDTHPKTNHWAFLELSEDMPTLERALAGSGNQEKEKYNLYLARIETVQAYEEAEDASYHLGPPNEQFQEVSGAKNLIVAGKNLKAKIGQGLRISPSVESSFTLRKDGVAVGKLLIQDGALLFEKGRRYTRMFKKLRQIKMLAVGPGGVKVEIWSATEILNGPAEGIAQAVINGTFNARAAVWLLGQMTQGSIKLSGPLPGYLAGLVEEYPNGIKAPPYIGGTVLNQLEYLTDGFRLAIKVEASSKVLVLKEGTSMYETHCDTVNLTDAVWERCVVKGLCPLG